MKGKGNIIVSIGTKLLLGVVFLILILGIFGIYLSTTLTDVRESFGVLDERYAALREITSIEHVHAIQTDATKSYILTGDEEWEGIYDNASLEFDLRINELMRFIQDSRFDPVLEEFHTVSEEMHAIELLILAKVREGNVQGANQLFDEEYQSRQLQSLEYLTALRLDLESSLSEVIQQNKIIILFSENVLVAFLIVLIVLITATALTISYMISSSLRELRDTVEAIINGDLSKRAHVGSSDEIGQLAVAFNEMTDKLEDSYHGLEEKVEEKTAELKKNVKTIQSTNTELERSQEALMNVMEDLSHEKARLAHAKSRDEAILSSIGDGVVVTDEQNRVLFANDQAAQLLKIPKTDLEGRDWTVAAPAFREGEAIHEHDRPISRAFELMKKVSTNEVMFQASDGSKIAVAITATPMILQDKIIGAVIVFRDISHEKAVDKAKTEFVSLASHQLKGPLTAIKWNVQLLLEGDVGEVSDEQREALRDMLDSNERMIDLVNSLLNVSRIELGTFVIDPEQADLRDIVDGIVKDQEVLIEQKKIHVRRDYPQTLPPVPVDVGLTRIVFQNVISNAVKYTPNNGSIDIAFSKTDEEIVFEVRDTGVGIPKDEQGLIFGKMFRSSNVTEISGNGLGLYIAKEIMDASGGRIWFESEEGQGTSFYVAIPIKGMKAKRGTKKLS